MEPEINPCSTKMKFFYFREPDQYFYCIFLQHGRPALYNLVIIADGNPSELEAFYFENGYLPGDNDRILGLHETQKRLEVDNG